MREDILLSHLRKSEFTPVQAETLSKILSEMATKEYIGAELALVRKDFAAELGFVRGELKTQMAAVRGDLTAELAVVKERLTGVEARMATREDLAREMARQTRWIIVAVGLLAALLGLPATILGVLNYLA